MRKENAFVFCFGAKGAGKTTALKRLAARARRLLVADATGDFEDLDLPSATDAAAVARLFARAGAGPCRVRLAADLVSSSSVYRGADIVRADGYEVRRLGLRAAAIAWAARDVVLVLDELALYCDPTRTPAVLAYIASYGRHRRVSLLATSRRPAEVSRLLTAQADLSLFFRIVEPRDLAYARETLGPAGNRLPTLAVGEALAVGNPACLEILGGPSLDRRRVRFVSTG